MGTDREYLIKALTFWEDISEEEREMILENTGKAFYKQGEQVHSAEQECIGVLIIKKGELRTYILSEEGKEITLFRQTEGDVCILTASCVLSSIHFDVHVDAEKESEVLVINAPAFAKLCENNVYIENFSLKLATEKFSDVMWAMEQILFMSFDRRLAIFLLDESAKNGTDSLTLTHEQIAKYMGSAREVVSRMLKYFVKEGIVEVSRGCIRILDKKKLKTFV